MIGPVERVVSLVPSHHIYGTLFTALLPDLLDIEVRSTRSGGALMRSPPGTLVIGTPALWVHVARTCPTLPPGLIGMSSTAPMPPELAGQLRGQGLDRLIEIYGSTETGGIGYREAPGEPYALLDYWQHLGEGEVVRDGADGRVRHRLMDRSTWRDDRHFQIEGRLDGGVQVGGTNVFPDRVRDVLLMHEGVADAAVRWEPSIARLKAFVVPRRNVPEAALVENVDGWCGERLADVERPRRFTLGRAIPRDAMGKPADW